MNDIAFPNGKKKAVTLSYDDNVLQNERLLEICKRNGLKCTFNVNSGIFLPKWFKTSKIYRIFSKKKAKQIMDFDYCEVATHGYFHKDLSKMSERKANKNIAKDKKSLEKIFGVTLTGHAYPMGAYNETVKKVLKKNGILYARTTNSTHVFDLPEDWYEWNPTCYHKDKEVVDDVKRFLRDDDAKLFYLWGHAFEFDADNNWDLIEEIAKLLGGREDVWYCTNGELYDWINGRSKTTSKPDIQSF